MILSNLINTAFVIWHQQSYIARYLQKKPIANVLFQIRLEPPFTAQKSTAKYIAFIKLNSYTV